MYTIEEKNALQIYDWCINREGVALWPSHDLSIRRGNSLTPWITKMGLPANQVDAPNWWNQKSDCQQLKLADIQVGIDKECRRFKVALRTNGMGSIVLTNASQTKLDKALADAGAESRFEFDYSTQEAVIYRCDKVVGLEEYMKGVLNGK